MIKSTPQRIELFDSLRALMSFWVLFAHIGLFAAITSPQIKGLLMPVGYFDWTAGFAVNVFMILSGFVICFLLDKGREGYFRFIFRRFFRLYPVFVLAIALGILVNPFGQYIHSQAPWSGHPWIQGQLELCRNDWNYLYQHLLTHVLLFHGMIPENVVPMTDAAFSGPGWSISLEWQFYLLAPLLFKLNRSVSGLIFFSALVVAAPYFPKLFPAINGGHEMRAFLPSQIAWFYTGMMFFAWYRGFPGFNPRNAKIAKMVFAFALIARVVLAGTFSGSFGNYSWLVSIASWLLPMGIWTSFFFLVVRGNTSTLGIVRKFHDFFNSLQLRYLGKISYPVYLLHWPIIIMTSRCILAISPLIDQKLAYGIMLIVVPTATVAVSHFTHLWVEAPIIDWARRFRANPRTVLAGASE